MYHIGICDDEPVFLHYIARMTKDILYESGIECDMKLFYNVWALEDYVNGGNELDLLLLDIILGKDNGMSFAHRLRDKENQLPIIFVTSSMDYALEGYTVDSLGYVTKPINRNLFKQNLLRAWEKHKKHTFCLTNPTQSISFQLNDVLYLDVMGKKTSIHLADGNILTITMSLSALKDQLPAEQFIQCHRGYIVSAAAVSSIWRYEIELKNKERIPVSKNQYSAVQSALMDWIVLQ